MKILHIIPSVALVRGGPSQAIIEMIFALRRLGIDAEIATTNDDGDNLLSVPLCQKTEYKGVPVWFFPRFSPPIGSVREFAFSARLTYWLWNNIDDYDLLHVHAIFSYPSTIAMAIARIKKVAYVCRPLGQLCNWSLKQSQQKKQTYLNLIEKANLNSAKAIHFTTEQERQEAANLELESSNFILPHGLSIPPQIAEARTKLRQQLKVAENEPIILFLSRLHAKKGLDYLIPALGKLSHKSFSFILAGNGDADYEIEVENLLKQHNINARTHKVGFVKGEEKNLLLQGADLFVLTSYSENFGVAVLEALAAGIPALVTPGVALADILQQEKIGYVTDLNIDTITSSIEHCLDGLVELKQKGDRAKQVICDRYTLERVAQKLLYFYQNIINCQTIS